MDIEPPIINKAVRELLEKMTREVSGRRWESMVTFSDGKGTTIIELNVYRGGGQERAGRIAYRLETGEVMEARYPGLGEELPESVVDLLLDAVNLEHQLARLGR
ncbi:MAG: hypothetical protein AAGN35_06825 [Bacteroidota bacterium]